MLTVQQYSDRTSLYKEPNMELSEKSPGKIALATAGLVTGALITGVIIVLRGGKPPETRATPLEIKWPVNEDDEEFPLAI